MRKEAEDIEHLRITDARLRGLQTQKNRRKKYRTGLFIYLSVYFWFLAHALNSIELTPNRSILVKISKLCEMLEKLSNSFVPTIQQRSSNVFDPVFVGNVFYFGVLAVHFEFTFFLSLPILSDLPKT